jgi:preprotein translocase subunit SecA
MPLEHLAALPASVRPLLTRAFSYATRVRWDEVDARGVAPPSMLLPVVVPPPAARTASEAPAVGKVGRNDPCPCGSGRKYKQCHGRLA